MPSEKIVRSVTQIPGVFAAHATDEAGATGCTVILCPAGAVGGVDVRGGAPATRETDLLRPEETVQELHAVVLSGGSAFGLAASCGVAEELERRGVGIDVGVARVPIVTGACLFDLACGDAHARPTAADGRSACAAALDEPGHPLERGNVGAGTGCTVGKLSGPERAVNACGDVRDPDTGEVIAGVREEGGALGSSVEALLGGVARMPLERANTTISCVVTNARLTKAQATKVAQMAADAYAHAITPTHTTNDGDTVFVMATGSVDAPVDAVGALAVRAPGRAVAAGPPPAESAYGYVAARDL